MNIVVALESDVIAIQQYLQQHEESAQYLINNLRIHGPYLTANANSGTYKIIEEDGDIRGIFALTKRGILIIEGSPGLDIDAILHHSLQEGIEITGFIGKWFLVNALLQRYQQINPAYSPAYLSKEKLYRIALPLSKSYNEQARLLQEKDFAVWVQLNNLYAKELNIPIRISSDKRQQSYQESVQQKHIWGLWSDTGKLISIANLTSCNDTIGQVGGVFTLPEHRKKGHSRQVMLKLLQDCHQLHGHRKSILFTGENNHSAQRLYTSIGYEEIGYFGLILH